MFHKHTRFIFQMLYTYIGFWLDCKAVPGYYVVVKLLLFILCNVHPKIADVTPVPYLKLHWYRTADQPTDQILWLGRVWSGKKLPALIEERIYPRSTPAVSLMHPRSNSALPDLPPSFRPTNPRSARPNPPPRPIPDTTTLTTLSIGPTPDLYAWFPLPISNE